MCIKETKLDFISYIWDDDCIRKLDENNWKCLWCNKTFQGINDTKSLAHVQKKMICILKLLCIHVQIPYNKIPRASAFQSLLEGYYSG